jgi:hypothetical protein
MDVVNGNAGILAPIVVLAGGSTGDDVTLFLQGRLRKGHLYRFSLPTNLFNFGSLKYIIVEDKHCGEGEGYS